MNRDVSGPAKATAGPVTLGALASVLGGRLEGGNPATPVAGLAIDSRQLSPGEAFFAVVGEKVDGHAFVGAAGAAGAAAAVVGAAWSGDAARGLPLVRVDDPREALLSFARWRLAGWGGTVIGVTGSSGKTTTKEFLAALLAERFTVFRTPGNFNNTLGLPLALFHLPTDARAAVLEMGMSFPGEIAALCRAAAPDIAVVTNVGSVHLQHFPDRAALARAKEEIVQGMKPAGTFVANADDPLVLAMAARNPVRTVTFGESDGVDVRLVAWRVEDVDRMSGTLAWGGRQYDVSLAMAGVHAFRNLAAAVAAARAAGLDDAAILSGIRGLGPVGMRGKAYRLADGIRLLDDSYNSNPEAMGAVIQTLGAWPGRPETLFVAGEMRELGPDSPELHAAVGRRLAGLGRVQVAAVAGDARRLAEAAEAAGVPARFFPDAAAAADPVLAWLRPGMLVVVKGSRGVGLDRVVQALRRKYAGVVVENE